MYPGPEGAQNSRIRRGELCQIVADLGSGLSAIHGILFLRWRNVFWGSLILSLVQRRLMVCMDVGIVAGRLETKISRP